MSNVMKNNHFFYHFPIVESVLEKIGSMLLPLSMQILGWELIIFWTHKTKARAQEPCVLLLCAAAAPPPGNDHLLILEHMV